ncbi:ubiquitin-specific protease ubp2 [Polyrhizophydium stewartii]|uniref:Ubiquitin-specific protease ubp2 n=1 Tax=Polyrhizophydium stewartii TaxID=2732419 RepID=A0ABR4NF72_9FUNG
MDKADADFLQHLFRENNALRARYTALQRELYNKTNLLENAEEEIKQLRIKIDQEIKPIQRPQTAAPAASGKIKDLEEAMFSIERQQAEIKQLREELNRSHTAFDDETEKVFNLTRENTEMATELRQLREFRDSTLAKEAELAKKPVVESTPEEIEMYQQQIKDLEAARLVMKQQMMEIALEANRVHNAQQNQLQGVEGLIEGIRREYDEFIQITKLENESFRALQQAEYESLKTEYEEHKNQSFEEKKRLTMEYQNILSAMQTQFDEYRATAELLFNVEMVKLEDEIASQASRYEQEIMYVIQAKDKFYSDMMVAKDAKIMGLIEGSDLQSIMQKHEMDMENARKEHAKELERVKSEHDSESKNVILLLQRQNVSLESKTEKLQTHLKSMEARMKELMNTIDLKNKTIAERDEARQKMEQEHHKKLGEANDRIATLAQEKEHLRHKVIRLNLNAKGEGENSIENMLKRLTRDTTSLHAEFEELGTKYDTLLNDNQGMSKQIKEKEKMVEFLEKELARRTQEFSDMTRTFEEFLSGRARQARKERSKRLAKIADADEHGIAIPGPSNGLGSQQVLGGNQLIRARIPDKGVSAAHRRPIVDDVSHAMAVQEKLPRAADIHSPVRTLTSNVELERGYVYLKRFKNLSRAFATGEFRALANTEQNAENMPGPWQKTPLYAKLDDASLAIAKVYREQPQKLAPLSDAHGHKPLLYIPPDTNRHLVSASGAPVRVYNEKMSDAEAQYKATRAKSTPRELDGLIVGGTHAV